MAECKITKENFEEEVLHAPLPVLVDFYADWCGPCKMLAPTVAQIAEEKEGTLKVGKINVDDDPELAARYGISSIPALYLFENGKPTRASIGYDTKENILEKLFG